MFYSLETMSPIIIYPVLIFGLQSIIVQSVLLFMDIASLQFEYKLRAVALDILSTITHALILTVIITAWYQGNLGMLSEYKSYSEPFAIFVICFAITVFVLTFRRGVVYLISGRKRLMPNSVKEAIDTLPIGLAFGKEDGSLLLANKKIYEIGFDVIGRDLQDLRLFWQLIKTGQVAHGWSTKNTGVNEILVRNDKITYQFSISRISLEEYEYYEMVILDVTEIDKIISEISDANEKFEAATKELKQMSFNEEMLRQEKELLRLKSFFHDELGRDVTMISRCLERGQNTEDIILLAQLISRDLENIKIRKKQNAKDALSTLKKLTGSVGVNLEITGEIPFDLLIGQIMVDIISEAVTNAVRHGKTDEVLVNIEDKGDFIVMEIENDGNMPAHKDGVPVREGGGIKGMRNRVKSIDGTMSIDVSNKFKIKFSFPKVS